MKNSLKNNNETPIEFFEHAQTWQIELVKALSKIKIIPQEEIEIGVEYE